MEQVFWETLWEEMTSPRRVTPHPLLLMVLQNYKAAHKILVPLCGVNYDLLWLANHGFHVTGVDFAKNTPEKFTHFYNVLLHQTKPHEYGYRAKGQFTLHIGDFMDFNPPEEPYHLIYDMGGLVALPAALRKVYASHLLRFLTPLTVCVILTKDLTQAKESTDSGPPFFIAEEEINSLFEGHIHNVTSLTSDRVAQITAYIITTKDNPGHPFNLLL